MEQQIADPQTWLDLAKQWGPLWLLVGYLLWQARETARDHREERKEKDEIIRGALVAMEGSKDAMKELRESIVRGLNV